MKRYTHIFAAGMLLALSSGAHALPGKVFLNVEDIAHDDLTTSISFREDPNASHYLLSLHRNGEAMAKQWFSEAEANCDGLTCTIKIDRIDDGDYKCWIRTWGDRRNGPWSDKLDFHVDHLAESSSDDSDVDEILAAPRVLWINHLALMPTDERLSAAATPTGELLLTGAGFLPDEASAALTALQVPPGFLVAGAELCFANSGAALVDALQLRQVGNEVIEPDGELDESACAEGASSVSIQFDEPLAAGGPPLVMGVQMSFSAVPDPSLDAVYVGGIALVLHRDSGDPFLQAIQDHSHTYLTGKGVGHNNSVAQTGAAQFEDDEDD